ncbi:diaminopimelate epimerase [Geothermobacter hydrogeniphilus]|uniref:Diaminopimelate epimerase n=1 Tax=Geothermobacter hydrogeniphilus TaxID=1969733 RepID=A0A2K2HEN3_9BACT|nr:diaminopimelate epimerase [Geothermobacter hydrogeniphilus]PNU21757.1 diaminopimelate epimerase [Geothermobacter hydrogeniphilus]
MKFTKMHGAGNDYVYVNGFEEQLADPEGLARRVSDRHFGIGSDGLILILPSERADLRMRIFNADGSEAQMCGNGVRCVAKYAWDHGLVRRRELTVETGAGILTLQLFPGADERIERVRVNMGSPRLTRAELPMTGAADRRAVDVELAVNGEVFRATCVSMGNPHCVIYVDDVERFPVADVGPLIEHHPWFPERINVHFVQVLSATEVRQRTWERGAGETLACGTGASAVCVAGVLTGRGDRSLLVHLPGGELRLEWAADGDVYMTGPATEVFSGEWRG